MKKQIIIGLAGRKGVGKTELAKICVSKGYTLLNFASALKELIANVLNISINELNQKKEQEFKFKISVDYLAKELNTTTEVINNINVNLNFRSIREALQVIGTDLIRVINPNWHIEQISKKINKLRTNIVIDDLRFKNELKLLKKQNAECFYILRPSNFNISNHDSEINLSWNDFNDNIVINNIALDTLLGKWSNYLETLERPFSKKMIFNTTNDKRIARKILIHKLKTKTTAELANEFSCSRDKIIWWCNNLMIQVNREQDLNINKKAFLMPTLEASYWAGVLTADGCIKFNKNSARISLTSVDKELVHGFGRYLNTEYKCRSFLHRMNNKKIYEIDCNNLYIMQNLKFWNIKPCKSQIEEIPDIIKNNIDCLKQWIVGLIDGDGSVFISKTGTLTISILMSDNIIYFLSNVFHDNYLLFAGPYPEKNTELLKISFHNKDAIKFYKWLNPSFYLKRKWNKIPFSENE